MVKWVDLSLLLPTYGRTYIPKSPPSVHTWCGLAPDLLTVRCFRNGPAYSGGMRASFAAVTASGVSPCMITIPGHHACAWCRGPPGLRCPHHTSRVGRAQMEEYSVVVFDAR